MVEEGALAPVTKPGELNATIRSLLVHRNACSTIRSLRSLLDHREGHSHIGVHSSQSMTDDRRMAHLADLPWPKQTERLTLRPMTKDDFKALWQIRRQESVGRWMTSRSEEWEGFAEMMSEDHRLGSTLVIERDGEVIGDLMLAVEDAWAQTEVKDRAKGVQAEIGWCIDPAVEGNGYATEAVVELIRVGFEELGLRRLVANCFADNEASWRLMERVGMRREAYNVADSLHRSGTWMDGMTYALLADEWRVSTELDQQR